MENALSTLIVLIFTVFLTVMLEKFFDCLLEEFQFFYKCRKHKSKLVNVLKKLEK